MFYNIINMSSQLNFFFEPEAKDILQAYKPELIVPFMHPRCTAGLAAYTPHFGEEPSLVVDMLRLRSICVIATVTKVFLVFQRR